MNDHAISYAFQQPETAAVTLAGSATLATSHSPFLADPALVVTTLMNLAQ